MNRVYQIRDKRYMMPIKTGAGVSKLVAPLRCCSRHQVTTGGATLLLSDSLGASDMNAVWGSSVLNLNKVGKEINQNVKRKLGGAGYGVKSPNPAVLEKLQNLQILDKKPKKTNVRLII